MKFRSIYVVVEQVLLVYIGVCVYIHMVIRADVHVMVEKVQVIVVCIRLSKLTST